MKTFINYLKKTFLFNLINSQVGLILIIFILILALARIYDKCSESKVVGMKEDVIYIKPNN